MDIRRRGGGGKKRVAEDTTLVTDLLALVEPDARGDPMSPLRWTCKSLSPVDAGLGRQRPSGQAARWSASCCISRSSVCKPIARRARATSHPDRNAQFTHLNESVRAALAAGEPVISVDTKKKELVGDFKNAGRAWRPQGEPEAVRVHDFLIKELGRAVPYGIYDLARNAGWVSVGMSSDTAAFAVQTIRRWWHDVGRVRYPRATRLTDHRGWRRQQRLAGAVCGNANCSALPMNWASTSSCITCRRAPANGTRSSTGCFRLSQ